jgi:hypothetical protein
MNDSCFFDAFNEIDMTIEAQGGRRAGQQLFLRRFMRPVTFVAGSRGRRTMRMHSGKGRAFVTAKTERRTVGTRIEKEAVGRTVRAMAREAFALLYRRVNDRQFSHDSMALITEFRPGKIESESLPATSRMILLLLQVTGEAFPILYRLMW